MYQANPNRYKDMTDGLLSKVGALNKIAEKRGQSLAQMALAWNLRHRSVCSVLIGASKVSQIEDCVASLGNLSFSREELNLIDEISKESGD